MPDKDNSKYFQDKSSVLKDKVTTGRSRMAPYAERSPQIMCRSLYESLMLVYMQYMEYKVLIKANVDIFD